MLQSLLILVLVGYLIWLAVLYFAQDLMIFPRFGLEHRSYAAPPVGFFEWDLATPEGDVHAWFLPARVRGDGAPRGTVVMLHGNGMLIEDWIAEASWFAGLGWNVLLPEYRGYGRAEGTPSEAALREDTLAFLERLDAERPEDGAPVVLYGRSIGGALAALVASERPPDGLILQTPPSSIRGMAMRYGAPPFLVRHPFDTVAALGSMESVPALLLEHDSDRVIPSGQSAAIREAAPWARHVLLGGDHNRLDGPGEEARFRSELTAFLDSLGRTGPSDG